MTPFDHQPATELNLVLPFMGGTVSLTVSGEIVSFTVQAQSGRELRRDWITADEYKRECLQPKVDFRR